MVAVPNFFIISLSIVISHIINERAYAISKGVGYFPAHASALDVESKIMGAATRTETISPAFLPGGKLTVEYRDPKGQIKSQYQFTLDPNLTPQ